MMQFDKIIHSNSLLDHLQITGERISAKIYPNLGGSIQELIVNEKQIIDGISNDQAGLDDYRATYKSSILFPFPNRIEDGSYSFMGRSHQFPVNEASVNNAIHGSVYNKSFDVTSVEKNREKVIVELTYVSMGSDQGFPFPYALKLTYTLLNKGSLSLGFDISNTGETAFPYGMGWHPYFVTQTLESSTLSFPSNEFYQCDERSLPVKTVPSPLPESFVMANKTFDDAYSLTRPECVFDSTEYKLSLGFDYSEGTYLQVYTPPHGKSIALEPMTCVANSFNNKIGLRELLPGETDSWTIQLDLNINS